MQRLDDNLAFMLRYENVAWYEGGKVRILDRRVYPGKKEFVVCENHGEVADAIARMVTQSGGPYVAAAMGMVQAAYEARNYNQEKFSTYLKRAAYILSHARPTTAKKMEKIVDGCLHVALSALEAGKPAHEEVFLHAVGLLNETYKKASLEAEHLVRRIPSQGTVMTQCFAETIVGTMLRECSKQGKKPKIICPETRPYFQGARLTASVVQDMGFHVTVIIDNMPGHVLREKKVDLFTSAADVICLDGHIVNKVGTFQIALAAAYWGIPYYVTGSPDKEHPTVYTVEIEERPGEEILEAMGVKVTMDGVKGYYPAFDVTPPKLCDGVVTDKGVFPPFELERYYL